MMAVAHLEGISTELIKRGRAATTPVAVIRDGTLPDQDVLVSTLEHVAADAARLQVRPPAVVVIGDVVGLRERLVAELTGVGTGGSDVADADRTRERGAA
jgi:uroporphyrinogen III methyltransferase/synthase